MRDGDGNGGVRRGIGWKRRIGSCRVWSKNVGGLKSLGCSWQILGLRVGIRERSTPPPSLTRRKSKSSFLGACFFVGSGKRLNQKLYLWCSLVFYGKRRSQWRSGFTRFPRALYTRSKSYSPVTCSPSKKKITINFFNPFPFWPFFLSGQ